MAKSLITASDIVGRVPSKFSIKSKVNTGELLSLGIVVTGEVNITARFQRAILNGTTRATADLEAALRDALKSGGWTTRDGTGDIVDTGNLLSSGRVEQNGNEIIIAYDAPYAALVHFGGYINPFGNTSLRVYLPPRPWVDAVLNGGGPVPQFEFAEYYRQALKEEFS